MTTLLRQPLNFFRFFLLSLILFGYFSWLSVAGYFGTPTLDPISAADFDERTNWISIAVELFLLAIAAIYLWWCRFDWSLINTRIDRYTLPLALLLVLIGALTVDLVLYGWYWLATGENPFTFDAAVSLPPPLEYIGLGLLLFSLLNGVYEELFFMGLAFAVKPDGRLYALIFSVFVRFIFHLYQGIPSAVAIALTGVVFILLRHRIRSIVPFALAHSVFDLFGAGIVGLFVYG